MSVGDEEVVGAVLVLDVELLEGCVHLLFGNWLVLSSYDLVEEIALGLRGIAAGALRHSRSLAMHAGSLGRCRSSAGGEQSTAEKVEEAEDDDDAVSCRRLAPHPLGQARAERFGLYSHCASFAVVVSPAIRVVQL